jgi:hypothetical protein
MPFNACLVLYDLWMQTKTLVPIGRRCVCGSLMVKTYFEAQPIADQVVAQWECQTCDLDERRRYSALAENPYDERDIPNI